MCKWCRSSVSDGGDVGDLSGVGDMCVCDVDDVHYLNEVGVEDCVYVGDVDEIR